MTTGNIVRSKKTGKDRYTPISTHLIQNETLTSDAKIILIYLLSLPSDWVVRKGWVEKRMLGMSRRKFNDAFKMLVELSYIHQHQQYRGNIKNGFNYVVYEEPTSELPNSDLPTSGEPVSVNRERSTTKYTETKYTNTNNTDTKETIKNNKIQNIELNNRTNTHTREVEPISLFELTPELEKEANRQAEFELQKLIKKKTYDTN